MLLPAILLLAACGSSADSAGASPSPSQTPCPATPYASSSPGTVTYLYDCNGRRVVPSQSGGSTVYVYATP